MPWVRRFGGERGGGAVRSAKITHERGERGGGDAAFICRIRGFLQSPRGSMPDTVKLVGVYDMIRAFIYLNSPDDVGAAVERSHVERRHVVLPLLVQVSLAGDVALHARHVVALHGLDHVHAQLKPSKSKRSKEHTAEVALGKKEWQTYEKSSKFHLGSPHDMTNRGGGGGGQVLKNNTACIGCMQGRKARQGKAR